MSNESPWSEDQIQVYCNSNGWERTGVYMNPKELDFFEAAVNDAEGNQIPELAEEQLANIKSKIHELAIGKGLPTLPQLDQYFFIGTGEFVKKWRDQ